MFLNKIRQFTATVTRTKRYVPNFVWSDTSWTFNLFRAYEYVCGRKVGIKAEVSSGKFWDEDTNKWFEFIAPHSLEAWFVVSEHYVRQYLSKLLRFQFKFPYKIVVYTPHIAASYGFNADFSGYRFAIAYDALGESTTGFGAGAITWTHVTSGSDRVLFISSAEPETSGWGGMTVTYNSVSVTLIGYKSVSNATSDWFVALFGLVAPASGSNTCSVTSNNTLGGVSTSYSGAKQTGFPDSYLGTNSGGSNVTSLNLSTTVVASDCWLVLCARSQSATALSAGTSTTLRGYAFMPTNKFIILCDSNGTVGTGSQTLQVTGASQKIGGVVASFAPSTGGGATFVPKTSWFM